MRRILSVCLLWASAAGLDGAEPFTFAFRPDETLRYELQERTSIDSGAPGDPITIGSEIEQTREWSVLKVDEDGVATLELRVVRLRVEQVMPDGEVMLYDSQARSISSPFLRDEMDSLVGVPLRRVRIDGRGRLIEDTDLIEHPLELERFPFVIALPEEFAGEGHLWSETYEIQPNELPRPVDMVRRFRVLTLTEDRMVVAFETRPMLERLHSNRRRMFFARYLRRGTVELDLKTGRMERAHISVDQNLDTVIGPGTYHRYVSAAAMELRPGKD